MNVKTEGDYTEIRFQGEIRTVLSAPLSYYEGGVLEGGGTAYEWRADENEVETYVTLPDG